MIAKSRTEYSAKNTSVALISRITAILMGYVLRVVFTHTLSESYVGVNGLFVDIINVLSLSEMGIGTAITFALYQPIAKDDTEKQKSLMRLYCRLYRIVAVVVAVIGFALIPFLGILIKDSYAVDHLILIYLMYLVNTVCSYLLIYKKALMDAHQLLYIGVFYQTMSWVVQDVFQIAVLILTRNFILFLSISIFTTILCNIGISKKADRLYPYLKDATAAPLPDDEKKSIYRNIRAMLMHKSGDVILNNTDNLILSSFVGLASVGSYSNYYLVIGSVHQLLGQVFQGITASVGNLGVSEDKSRVRNVFEAVFFMGQWMYGLAAICLYELLGPFVELSFGKQYLFSKEIVLMLCINFFINGMRGATLVFRDSLGLFWYDRYKSVVWALLNLVLSILLVGQMGVVGVFLGTFISTMATAFWIEPYVLYKYRLKVSSRIYFVRYIIYTMVAGGVWFATDYLCQRTTGTIWMVFAERLLLCIVVPNILFVLLYFRTREFRFLWIKLMQLMQKRRGR